MHTHTHKGENLNMAVSKNSLMRKAGYSELATYMYLLTTMPSFPVSTANMQKKHFFLAVETVNEATK